MAETRKTRTPEQKKYTFYWRDGQVEEHLGITVSDAYSKLGYSAAALKLLDYYKEEVIDRTEE